jgi:hypothetical protein
LKASDGTDDVGLYWNKTVSVNRLEFRKGSTAAGLKGHISFATGDLEIAGNLGVSGGAGITATGYNSTNWDAAYDDRNKWDGTSTGLNANTGRTSLELGTSATLDTAAVADAATTVATGDQIHTFVTSLGYTTNTGTVTSVGTDSPLAGTVTGSGNLSINLDSLPAMTQAWQNGTDEFIVLDDGTQKKKLSSEIFGTNAFTSYSEPTYTSAIGEGNSKLVPAAGSGNSAKFLANNGTWQIPNYTTNTTHSLDIATNTTSLQLSNTGGNSSDLVEFVGSGATTVTRTNANKFTISSTDNNTNYYLNGITKSGVTLTFAVENADPVTYTFGANAFTDFVQYSFPYSISTAEGGNTVVRRVANGYIYTSYYNGSGTFATSAATGTMGMFTGTNGNDTFGRSYSAAMARTLLNVADGADVVSIATNAADVLGASNGAISADDATKDKLVYWDEGLGKLKYLTFADLTPLPA